MLHVLLRDAARSLRHDRRFAGLAIGLLSVTLGALTATYAVVHAVALEPLPFADQDRLIVVWQRDDRRALPVVEIAYDEMTDWRSRSRSLEGLAVVGSVNWSLTLVGPPGPQTVPFSAVSSSFFRVLGAVPDRGRAFVPGDETGATPRVMVISHGLWVRRFGGDVSIIGRAVPVRLDVDGPDASIEVAGVMPRAFDYPKGADVWLPAAPVLRRNAGALDVENVMRGLRVFFAVGRLRPGVRVPDAARELTQVMRTSAPAGGPEPNEQLVLTPIAEYLLGPAAPVLWTLLAGAALMLMVACANVAGLQVSRAARGQRALAIRLAVGASMRHVVGQSVVESALLTGAAALGAIAVAWATARGLIRLAPADVPRLDRVALLDPAVVAVGAGAAFFTILLCGLWPTLAARRVDAVSVLVHGAATGPDPMARRIQRGIVVAQVAIALALLAGTGLFVRTVRGLDHTVLGFDPDGLLAFAVSPDSSDPGRRDRFDDELLARVAALPDVAAAAAVANRPLSGPIGWDTQPILHGQAFDDPAAWSLNPHTNLEVVTPGYFETMGIRLVRGRTFSDRDRDSSPGVVVLSETAARRLWPGRDAIGQRLRDPLYRAEDTPDRPSWQTVVGIVEDVRYRGLNDVRLDLYLPAGQATIPIQHLMVRTRGAPAGVVASVRAAVRDISAGSESAGVVAMTDVVAAESAPWRFLMQIFMLFAGLAAALGTIGLGAVVGTTVAARRRELAIRAALGADRATLRSLVLRDGLGLVGLGVAAGLAFALGLGQAVAPLLVGVGPHDWRALVAAAGLSAITGLLAAWLPARRASHVHPIEAVRE